METLVKNKRTTQTSDIILNGWDTIYALPFTEVNKAIVAKAASPTSFTESEVSDDGAFIFEGSFDHWSLTTGGDGRTVMMKLPIPTSSFSFNNSVRNYTNMEARIQVNLEWVRDPDNISFQSLQMNNDDKTVFVIDITADERISIAVKGIMKQYLHNWLIDNSNDFEHVFSTVNVNEIADQDGYSWMMPSFVDYAVVDGDPNDLSKSIFGVLCMTENRPSPGAPQIPPFSFAEGSNSALLVSKERFMRHMVYPNIASLFIDMTTTDFNFDDASLQISNNKDLKFKPQEIKSGKKVELSLEAGKFLLEIVNDRLVFNLEDLQFTWSPGIKVHFNHISTAVISVPSGNFKLDVSDVTNEVEVTTSGGVIAAEIFGSIAIAFIASFLGGFIGGEFASAGGQAVEDGAEQTAIELANQALQSGAEDATSASASASVDESSEAATQAVSNLAPELVQEVETEAPGKFSQFFANHWKKLLGGLIGILIDGGLVAGINVGLPALAKGDVVDFENFGKSSLSPVSWPNVAKGQFDVVDGSFNGALKLDINLVTN